MLSDIATPGMHDTPLPEAMVVAERLREAVAEFPWHGIDPGLEVTISVGLVESFLARLAFCKSTRRQHRLPRRDERFGKLAGRIDMKLQIFKTLWGHSGDLDPAIVNLIVTKEGQTVTADEIKEWCRERIAGFKVPKSVDFRTEPLPLSGAMKVLKRELRAPYWEGRERSVQ